MTTTTTPTTLNGLNVADLHGLVEATRLDPANAQTNWSVRTKWVHGAVSQTRVNAPTIAGKQCAKDFTIGIDEPLELGGKNQYPNPQEYLLAALNGCMTVGYVAGAALMGIKLESLEIRTEGDIDLRGFLGNPDVKAGYDGLRYSVHVKGDGTPEQFEELHRNVMATSPNYFNLSRPIPMSAKLVVG